MTRETARPSQETLAARQALARDLLERAALAAKHALTLDLLEKVHEPISKYPYRGWESVYREQWKYDSFGRTTHSINCTDSCTWKVYVRNNIAFKEDSLPIIPTSVQLCPRTTRGDARKVRITRNMFMVRTG